MTKTLQENLAQQLCESVERLQQHVEKVEFWASAVSGLSNPIPDYEPENTAVDRYLKPGRPPRKRHRRKLSKKAANSNDAAETTDTANDASSASLAAAKSGE